MGDSTAMTIEFLRARLLSERTVSRTARQRAEQLARRVVELEEQLKIMVIQRKKAEKAASQVLTILENREGDPTEVTDSSSDPDDDDGESKRNDVKEYEMSNTSRVEKSELEDALSGSETEVSPSQGRSLSWKGRSSSPDSHEKQKMKYIRQRQRRSSFTSVTEPSEKPLSGRSCRKIKRKETRSTAEDGLDNHMLNEHGEGAASWSHHSDKQPKCPQEPPNNEMEEEFPHTLITCSLDDQIKETGDNLYTDGRDRYEEMERVLEKQARLIGQYEAEENAQREWEEKYNENKSSTLSPGNQHNTAETHTELKVAVTDTKPSAENVVNTGEPAQSSSILSFSTVPTPHSIRGESNNEATVKGLSNGSVPPNSTKSAANSSEACSNGSNTTLNHQHNGISIQNTETGSHEFAFPAQESSNVTASYHINSSSNAHGNGIPGSSSSGSPSSVNSGNRFSKCQSLDMPNDLQRLPPQSPSRRLGGVLQALQHAKVSLGQLGGHPSSNHGSLATVVPTESHVRTMDIPVVPTGLFRLPTDSYPQTSLSVPTVYTYPEVGYGITSREFQYPTATYSESRSRVSVGRQYFDPYITSVARLPSTTRHPLPYSHLSTERTFSQDGFPRPGMELRNELAAGDRYNVYGNVGALTDIWRP